MDPSSQIIENIDNGYEDGDGHDGESTVEQLKRTVNLQNAAFSSLLLKYQNIERDKPVFSEKTTVHRQAKVIDSQRRLIETLNRTIDDYAQTLSHQAKIIEKFNESVGGYDNLGCSARQIEKNASNCEGLGKNDLPAIANMKCDNEELTAMVQRLRYFIEEQCKENQILLFNNEEQQNEINTLKKEVSERDRTIRNLSVQVGDLQGRITEQDSATFHAMSVKIESSEAEYNELECKYSSAREELAEYSHELRKALAEKVKIEKVHSAEMKTLRRYADEKDLLLSENSIATEKLIEAKQSEIEELEQQMEYERKNLRDSSEKVIAEMSLKFECERKQLTGKLNSLAKQLDESEDRLKQELGKTDNFQLIENTLQKQISLLRVQMEESEQQKSLLRGTVQDLETEIASMALSQCIEMKQGASITVSKAENLQSKLGELLQTNRSLKKCVKSLEERFNCDIASVKDKLFPIAKLFLEEVSAKNEQEVTKLKETCCTLKTSNSELLQQLGNEKSLRKSLHNELIEIKGNIRVHCRVRPVLGRDGKSRVVVNPVEEDCVRVVKNGESKPKEFSFDKVYGPTGVQCDVHEDIFPLLDSFLDGYNVCLMAYGQTGSGKTFTMFGPDSDSLMGKLTPKSLQFDRLDDPLVEQELYPSTSAGVIPAALCYLFRKVQDMKENTIRGFKLCMYEIYNEKVQDLIKAESTSHSFSYVNNSNTNLNESQDGHLSFQSVGKNVCTNGIEISSVEEAIEFINRGFETRSSSSTLVHDQSSRSHCVVRLTVLTNDGSDSNSSLTFVDLAGSECAAASGAVGTSLREASNINKSLSALCDVLNALNEKRKHVPYRNSKLTHMLKDCIGGDAKLLIFVCVSPTETCFTESVRCLNFGSRARQIEKNSMYFFKKNKPNSKIPVQLNSSSTTFTRTASGLSNSPLKSQIY
eukprot:Nk52_evm19s490 gene=Nk52_evmTU19s490